MHGYVYPAAIGNLQGTFQDLVTEEIISGVRAVNISQSGYLRIAMAAISGRMPATGIVIDNTLSGGAANVYTVGQYQFPSGMANFSGYVGHAIWVGNSGQIVVMSGSWASGGVFSGGLAQKIGRTLNSGAIVMGPINQHMWSGFPATYGLVG